MRVGLVVGMERIVRCANPAMFEASALDVS
jgi:hypothetical protein